MATRVVSTGFTHASCRAMVCSAIVALTDRLGDDDVDELNKKELDVLKKVLGTIKTTRPGGPRRTLVKKTK